MRYFLFIIKPIAVRLYRKYRAIQLKNLIDRGLIIGKNVYINRDVIFDHSFPYLIEIQDNCRISRGVRFLAHDATPFRGIGVTRAAKVRVLEGTFIGENALILPGVTIGPNALIAAGAMVNRDIGEDMCAAGNPARPYGKFPKLLERYCKKINEENFFDIQALKNGELSVEEARRLCDQHGNIFTKGLDTFGPRYINLDLSALEKEHQDALATLRRMKVSLPQSLSETNDEAEGGAQL